MQLSRFLIISKSWICIWKKSDKLTHTFMRFPRFLIFPILEFVFEKKLEQTRSNFYAISQGSCISKSWLYLKKIWQTCSNFYAIFQDSSISKSWIRIWKRIRTNSLKLLCDFPGFWYVSSLNLNLEFFQMVTLQSWL